jgi:hypothetical protein
MKKKIAIIGRGTAGAQSALHFNAWAKDQFEVEWYFDNSIPPASVGEGATLPLPRNLMHTQGWTYRELDRLGGTLKTGIFKKNWGKNGEEFYHDFFPPETSIHFQAHMLHKYALDELEGKMPMHDTFVGSSSDIDADFVLDCSGTPKELGIPYMESDHIPVNTARVWQCPWDGPTFNYTLAIAGKFGWIFGIPLTNRCSIGYIYNKDFATPEQIEEDVQQVFDEYNLTPGPDGNYIEFKSYWRRKNFKGRTGYNGNASFFLEPLEATSTATMDLCQRKMFDWVTGALDEDTVNRDYLTFMQQTETMIMMHYLAEPKFKTDFWMYANDRARKMFDLAKDDLLLGLKLGQALEQMGSKKFIPDGLPAFSTWSAQSFAVHIQGLGIEQQIRDYIGAN